MFCPKCGTQNPDGSKFCKGCGAPLGAQSATGPHAGVTGAAPASAPSPLAGAAPAPGPAQEAAEKPRVKARVPVVAVVVTIAAVLVVGLATRWFGLAGSGLKAGTYYLGDSSGHTEMMLSVHGDGVVGVTMAGKGTFEGRSKAKRSNGHLVIELSDPNFAIPGTSASDVSDLSVSLILPSGLDKGSYAGDYAFRMSGTEGSDSYAFVVWFRLGDDGNVYFNSYSSDDSSEDPKTVFDSIANGSWSDDDAQQMATWRANDDGSVGFGFYDASGNLTGPEPSRHTSSADAVGDHHGDGPDVHDAVLVLTGRRGPGLPARPGLAGAARVRPIPPAASCDGPDAVSYIGLCISRG